MSVELTIPSDLRHLAIVCTCLHSIVDQTIQLLKDEFSKESYGQYGRSLLQVPCSFFVLRCFLSQFMMLPIRMMVKRNAQFPYCIAVQILDEIPWATSLGKLALCTCIRHMEPSIDRSKADTDAYNTLHESTSFADIANSHGHPRQPQPVWPFALHVIMVAWLFA